MAWGGDWWGDWFGRWNGSEDTGRPGDGSWYARFYGNWFGRWFGRPVAEPERPAEPTHSSGYGTVGIGCCCGGGTGTPTYLDCDVTCSPTTYTTSVPQTFCFSLAGVTTSGVCDSVGGRYTSIQVSLCGDGCPINETFSWVNINTDRTDTICNVFSCIGPPWDGSTGEPSWQVGLGYFCVGYSEPMMVLYIHGNEGGIFPWYVYYTCPLDTFDWNGPNTFDLYSQNGSASTFFTFPASLVLTPCGNPAGLP
jgi:hypothetical protein